MKASDTDNTFKTMHAKLEAASKKPADGNRFENGYPCNRPLAGIRGDARGIFSDLEILVGVAIYPKGNNKCLTRPENGMFT